MLALVLTAILFRLHLLRFEGHLRVLLLLLGLLGRLLLGAALQAFWFALLLRRVLLLGVLLLHFLIDFLYLLRLLSRPSVCRCVHLARLQLLKLLRCWRLWDRLECLVVVLWEESDVSHLEGARFLGRRAITRSVCPSKTSQVLVRSR